jgi:hypothetical protein
MFFESAGTYSVTKELINRSIIFELMYDPHREVLDIKDFYVIHGIVNLRLLLTGAFGKNTKNWYFYGK